MRKPFQGVINIIRFNWHYYVLSVGMLALLLFISRFYFPSSLPLVNVIFILSLVVIFVSLAVSTYIYDFSSLYSLSWLNNLHTENKKKIANIHAGFDETSVLLKEKYSNVSLSVFDFYDPKKHIEVSIKRARKAYPAFPGTISIDTSSFPCDDNSLDTIFLILAAHEIRNDAERINFFREIKRSLSPAGKIIVTEHLRNMPNLLAYNIGAFHFHSEKTWKSTFRSAGLTIEKQFNITPFITTFILSKNGNAS